MIAVPSYALTPAPGALVPAGGAETGSLSRRWRPTERSEDETCGTAHGGGGSGGARAGRRGLLFNSGTPSLSHQASQESETPRHRNASSEASSGTSQVDMRVKLQPSATRAGPSRTASRRA